MKKTIIYILLFIGFNLSDCIAQNDFNVDVLPTNIGGKAEFKRVFEQELTYPSMSLNKHSGGKVIINFLIMKDSSVTNIKVSGIADTAINTEALRLFKLFQWVPAIKEGQSVSANWSVEFDFKPEKYAKICNQRGFVNFRYIKDWKIDTTGNRPFFVNWKIDSSGFIYKHLEEFPMYPKGNYALQDFIKENLEYPRQAQLANIQGTVVLRFVVEPTGLVTNIGVEKPVGGGCDQEAIRVLQLIKWYPGRINGDTLVRTQMTFPIYFILNDEFRDNSAGEQK